MKRFLAAAAAVGVLLGQHAWAATQSTTINVSAQVDGGCTVNTTPLQFLSVASGATPTDTTATVNVDCTNGLAYYVGLDYGQYGVGQQRYMNGTVSGDKLEYNLYSDAAHNTAWGNTLSVNTVQGVGSGAQQPLTVYGEIPGSQIGMADDNYSDTVTVTVTY